jgi:hypothetical protein
MNPMETHVKVLAVLHIAFGIVSVLIGVSLFALFGGIATLIQMDGDPDAAIAVPLMGSIGGFLLIASLVLSLPGIVAGFGLLSFRPWARILGIVVSVLILAHIPFGTALGVYGLWVLFSRDGVLIFEQRGATPSVQY